MHNEIYGILIVLFVVLFSCILQFFYIKKITNTLRTSYTEFFTTYNASANTALLYANIVNNILASLDKQVCQIESTQAALIQRIADLEQFAGYQDARIIEVERHEI